MSQSQCRLVLDSFAIALVISISMFFSAFVPIFSSRIEKIMSSHIVVSGSLLIMSIAAFNLFASTFFGLVYYGFSPVLFGMATAPLFAAVFDAVMDFFRELDGLRAVSTLTQIQMCAYVIAIPVFGFLFYGHVRDLGDMTDDALQEVVFSQGYRELCLFFAAYFLAAFAVFSLSLVKRRKQLHKR